MELTPSLVAETAAEYRNEEPLYAVESEHLEILPKTFASGEYGWRDAEWPVQWYHRRHLGAFPDEKRREAESAFRDNDFGTVTRRIEEARAADAAADALDHLTALSGIDVGVASAFLFFLDSSRYLAVGHREWGTLREAGELSGAYPDPPSTAAYERYLGTCRRLADRFECDLWTLYRALWRLSDESALDR